MGKGETADKAVPTADELIVQRLNEASAPNLGRAAERVALWYQLGAGNRREALLAVADALGVDRVVFDRIIPADAQPMADVEA